ncbi:MAG: hypothetical protein PVJ49_13380 [Acidobacteriota bacterium]
MAPSLARRREEQGRLFWAWLLTLPIILLLAAARAFGTPWPNPMTQRIAMVMLAFPVVFVVGEPLLSDAAAALRRRAWHPAVIVAPIALACYASGMLALLTAAPAIGGVSALVVSTYLTARYLSGRY